MSSKSFAQCACLLPMVFLSGSYCDIIPAASQMCLMVVHTLNGETVGVSIDDAGKLGGFGGFGNAGGVEVLFALDW